MIRSAVEWAESHPSIPPDYPLRASLNAWWISQFCRVSPVQPFVLLDWEIEVLAGMYPGEPDTKRVIQRAMVSTARKQGKSGFGSVITVLHTIGPEAIPGLDSICAATTTEQACIVYEDARDMIRWFIEDNPRLEPRLNIVTNKTTWKTANGMEIVLKPISGQASSAQGKKTGFFNYDEIAEAKNRDLFEALDYSSPKSVDKRLDYGTFGLITSTRSTAPDNPFDIVLNEIKALQVSGQQAGRRWYWRIWSADPGSNDYFDDEGGKESKGWAQLLKANPSIGVTIDEDVRWADFQNAVLSTSARPGYRSRVLNIESGDLETLIDPHLWASLGTPKTFDDVWTEMKGEKVAIAFDGGDNRSMTALTWYFPNRNFICTICWMWARTIKENERRHSATYRDWAKDGTGWFRMVSDSVMNWDEATDLIADSYRNFEVLTVRTDRYKHDRLLVRLASEYDLVREREPLASTFDVMGMGEITFTEPILRFQALCLGKEISHPASPSTNLCVSYSRIEQSSRSMTSAMKFEKRKGMKLPNDAAMTMVMAVADRGLYAQGAPVSLDKIASVLYRRKSDDRPRPRP